MRRARDLARGRLGLLAWLQLGTGVALGVYTGILLSTLGATAIYPLLVFLGGLSLRWIFVAAGQA